MCAIIKLGYTPPISQTIKNELLMLINNVHDEIPSVKQILLENCIYGTR